MEKYREKVISEYEAIAFNPLLTDAYQFSMGGAIERAIINNKKFDQIETFELFFRKNPFNGSFAIAGGMSDAIKCIVNWKFTDYHENLMKLSYGNTYDQEYYDKLKSLNVDNLDVYSVLDGELIFANEPMMRLTGNALLIQILETTLLNIIGHATLVATNARRIKLRSNGAKLLEFGCRRAQGSSGAINSARYSYIGGFDGTSNVLASAMYNIPISGTHAHSFVMRFINIDDVSETLVVQNLKNPKNPCDNFKQYVLNIHKKFLKTTHDGELGAFIQYAYTYPSNFLALVDTYDTLSSGIVNFCSVAIALIELGYKPIGIRIDSGNLAELSIHIDNFFTDLTVNYPDFSSMTIVASNDLDESSINDLVENGSKCNTFGVGTNLATAKDQPSLGCVYKLVDRGGFPRIKKSEEKGKTTIPGKKYIFRLFDHEGFMLADMMSLNSDIEGNSVILYDIKNPEKLPVTITFSRYEPLLKPVISSGNLNISFENATLEGKERCRLSMITFRDNFTRKDCDQYTVGVDKELMELAICMV